MEFVRSAKKHSTLLSETIYILLNVGLALAVFYLVYLFREGVPALAYLIVILSKWRILAVRPRFWWDNFQSNLLDLMLGLSAVTILWQTPREAIALQIMITALYVVWLIVLKPMTNRTAVLAQAMVAQFFAIVALFSVASTWPSWLVAAAMWAVGYVTVRHALTPFEERDTTQLSLIWGLVMAELGWLAYHWTIAYNVIGSGALIKIPQIALIVTLLSYFIFQLYTTYNDKKSLNHSDIIWPAVFAGSIILLMLIFFNSLDPNSP